MKKLIIFTFCLICGVNLFGQSQAEFLNELGEKYESIKSLHAKVEVTRSDSPKETVEIWYDEEHSLIQSSQFEMMVNKKYFVVVDKNGKRINIQDRKSTSTISGVSENYSLPIDSLLKMSTEIQLDTIQHQNKIALSMVLDHPLIKEMTINLDLDLNLKSVSYQYNSPDNLIEDLEVVYKIFDVQPALSNSQFSINNYIYRNGQMFSPVDRFSGYVLNEVRVDNNN